MYRRFTFNVPRSQTILVEKILHGGRTVYTRLDLDLKDEVQYMAWTDMDIGAFKDLLPWASQWLIYNYPPEEPSTELLQA